jgi:hypothetical protein
MKEIPLTQGKAALVSDDKYEMLSCHKWYAVKRYGIFYAVRRITTAKNKQKEISMHRVIMDAPKGVEVDHFDGDGLNNQNENLRLVTHRQNIQNLHSKRTSIYPGVCWHKVTQKWSSSISIDGRQKHLGVYSSELEAFKAYVNALESMGEVLLHFSLEEENE